MAIAPAVEADDRALAEIAQRKGAQFGIAFAGQCTFGERLLLGRHERDGFLRAQPHAARAVFGCQPELDLDAGCGVPPVAGEDETLLELRQNACSSWMPRRRILALSRGSRPCPCRWHQVAGSRRATTVWRLLLMYSSTSSSGASCSRCDSVAVAPGPSANSITAGCGVARCAGMSAAATMQPGIQVRMPGAQQDRPWRAHRHGRPRRRPPLRPSSP